jgi:two-component system OmpR family response regulator
MRILLVEDEPKMAAALARGLRHEGYAVDSVGAGDEALFQARVFDYDAVVLDVMLPGEDGFGVCTTLRREGRWVPVLMLTARDRPEDRIRGLDAGADDYLSKPFDLDELLARLRALYRRSSQAGGGPVEVGDLVVDPVSRRVSRRGVEITLSAREFDILHLLAVHAGGVVTRLAILDEVWDGETDIRSNVIDVHLAAIRAKIDKPYGTDTITTLRGVGYRLETAVVG